jgi:hypothetical protein
MRKYGWVLLAILALVTSLPCAAQVLKGSKPPVEKSPSPNRLLLPSSAFAGGVLTGYVIGPDNQPVPNAPVAVNGGMLMGEVIGEPIKKDEKQRSTSGGPWMPSNQFGPEYGRPGSFTDWQTTALDFCKQGPHQIINPGPPGTAATVNPGPPTTTAGGNPGPPDTNPGPPDKPSFQWGSQGGTAASPQWGGFTNAAGGFIVCVPADAKNLQVSTGGDSSSEGAVSILIGLNQLSARPGLYDPPYHNRDKSYGGDDWYDPPFFCGRGQRFDLNGAFPHASYEQGGKAGEMPVAMALNGDGKTALTTVECSNNLHPGLARFSITDGTSRVREFQTHIFQFIGGNLDRNQLMGGQPADFWYDIQMGPEQAGKSLCVAVTVAGPVVLTKPPAHKFTLNGDGRGRISGKIRATHVAPGSTVPFVISPHFSECGK